MNGINGTRWICFGLTAAMAMTLVVGCAKKDNPTAARQEMVLCRPLISKIQTLDPGNARDVYSALVVSQICEPLYVYHYLKRPYQLIPLLAEAMPEISPDGLVYTIRIKKGIRFQDDTCFPGGRGREMKAADFVYALKRIANVKYAGQNWSLFEGRIVGLNAFREYTKGFKKEWDVDYSRPVEGLRTLDDYTLQIKLTKPWPQILEIALNDYCTSPIAKEAVDYYGQDIIAHPIGTGPYKLKVWQKSTYVELVRNENWRGELYPSEGEPGDREKGLLDDAGKPVPFADRIIFRIIEEDQPNWFLFMRGKLDVQGIPKDNFDKAVSVQQRDLTPTMKNRDIRLFIYNEPSTFWIGFNFRDPVLGNNLPLRKAICRAIDRRRMTDILYNGRMDVAHGLVPPGLNSYDPNIVEYGYSKYDVSEARELLRQAEAIYGKPIPKLTLAMPGTDTFFRQTGQLIQRQFEQAGLTLEVDYMDWPTYQERQNKGQCQMFISGTSASCPDAIDFLDMFTVKNFAPGGNKFFYSNLRYEELFKKAEVMQDCPERTKLYRQLEHIVLDDYPAAFLNHRRVFYLLHDWYKNYKPCVFGYGFLKYHWVDMEQRDEYPALLKKLEREGK
jgi:oligopeptide transport system substrate-binding protein